jgi:putative phosphoribosyl transferase
MGAIGEGNVRVLDPETWWRAGVTDDELADVERQERAELDRRSQLFRGERPLISLVGRSAVVVDDGIATGSTARAACRVARAHGAARVVLAAPVCAPDVARTLGDVADEMVCLMAPKRFLTVGQFYADFRPTSEAEVVELLRPGPGSYPVDTRDDPPPVAGTPR